MKVSIKNALTAIGLGTLVIMPLQAKDPSTDNTKKQIRNEVGIMQNILQASLKQQSASTKIRFRAESVFYLADQGVVFEIDGSRHGGDFFGFDFSSLNGLISSTVSPSSISNAPNQSFERLEIKIDEDEIERMVMQFVGQGDHNDDFVEHSDHYDDNIRDKMRDLSEEQRELAWEKRESQRRKRDLEFEKRSADGDRRKNIEENLTELNQEIEQLEAKLTELDQYLAELKLEQDKKVALRSAAKKKLYDEALAVFEDTVGSMLCSYGAGLKSLPVTENITFVLTDFVQAEQDSVIGTHDKVYVFKHKDVKSCVTGRISKEQLLTSVNSYLF